MRTKSLLAAAAFIAVGVASSMAQANVYSLNIVGYVNVGVTNGELALLNNPLKPSNGNYSITNVLKLQDPGSDGTTIFQWNPGTSSWDSAGYIDGFGFDTPLTLDLGKGFFVQPTTAPQNNQTITFVGEVQTGTSTNAISGALSLLGSKVPVAGPAPGGTVGGDGDTIFTWDALGNSWVSSGYIGGFGWDSPSTNGPALRVAEGFFYQIAPGNTSQNWITTLNP